MLLLGAAPRSMNLSRTVPPSATHMFATAYDAVIARFLAALLSGVDELAHIWTITKRWRSCRCVWGSWPKNIDTHRTGPLRHFFAGSGRKEGLSVPGRVQFPDTLWCGIRRHIPLDVDARAATSHKCFLLSEPVVPTFRKQGESWLVLQGVGSFLALF